MCTVVRFVTALSGAVPWDRARMTVNVPAGLPHAATMFILRETLRLIGAPQPIETAAAACFCGEAVELPTARAVAASVDKAAVAVGRAVRHGA